MMQGQRVDLAYQFIQADKDNRLFGDKQLNRMFNQWYVVIRYDIGRWPCLQTKLVK